MAYQWHAISHANDILWKKLQPTQNMEWELFPLVRVELGSGVTLPEVTGTDKSVLWAAAERASWHFQGISISGGEKKNPTTFPETSCSRWNLQGSSSGAEVSERVTVPCHRWVVHGLCASPNYCRHRGLFGDVNLMKFYKVKYLQYWPYCWFHICGNTSRAESKLNVKKKMMVSGKQLRLTFNHRGKYKKTIRISILPAFN